MNRAQRRKALAALVMEHLPEDGRRDTAVEGLSLFRASEASPIRCMVYHPCVIIVAQGAKTAAVGGQVYEYSPSRYLVLPVSLPIDAKVVEATTERPFLSLAVGVDPTTLGELVEQLEPGGRLTRESPRGIAVSETTDELLDAAVRFVSCLASPTDERVLAPQVRREILYRVLTGPQGDLLKGVGYRDARLHQVSRALSLIHREFGRPIEVGELAKEAHMSASTFYEAFKAVTAQSPLQYLKEIRLSRARQIMIWEGTSATRAASMVGYGSASQFSREFKRRFGRAPTQEVEWAAANREAPGVAG